MKKQLALALIALSCAQAIPIPPEILDPGNATLLIGNTFSGSVEVTGFILRTHDQQQTALTFFDEFPSGTLNAQAGVTIILKPQLGGVAAKMSALGLTVGHLDALNNWNPGVFAGIIGIDSPDVLAFGGSNFLFDVGINGSPVQFTVQNYNHVGIDPNRFITQDGLNQGYRLGFDSEPLQPFEAPDSGSTALLLLVGVVGLILLRIVATTDWPSSAKLKTKQILLLCAATFLKRTKSQFAATS